MKSFNFFLIILLTALVFLGDCLKIQRRFNARPVCFPKKKDCEEATKEYKKHGNIVRKCFLLEVLGKKEYCFSFYQMD
ncbi:MAG: hypothetical protein MJ252_20485 [archaeon]|nr:hypothetical protein [archaeon]